MYQIYKTTPKLQNVCHYTQDKPNHTQQADTLFFPHGSGYTFAIKVIDIASRYKDTESLKAKAAFEVSKAMQTIYSRSPLNLPRVLMLNVGRKFITLLKEYNTKICLCFNNICVIALPHGVKFYSK